MPERLVIRKATTGDLESITEIYNHSIQTSNATFDLEPRSLSEQRAWFQTHGDRYPILVAESDRRAVGAEGDSPSVIGWASLSPWSDRCGYRVAVEVSVYVSSDHQGRGVGRQLCQAILTRCEQLGFHAALARITAGNQASLRLFERFGFEQVGLLKEVGYKFGQLLDVHVLERIFPSPEGRLE